MPNSHVVGPAAFAPHPRHAVKHFLIGCVWPSRYDSRMDLHALLGRAFDRARAEILQAPTLQQLHARRSRAWVRAMAEEFASHYRDEPDVRVLSKGDERNLEAFGLTELLYDVLVCRTAQVASAVQGKMLTYVTGALWQVESEFDCHNSRSLVVDFNKLVIGAAANKLFVGPLTDRADRFLEVLGAPARHCPGSVHLCIVPPPSDWSTTQQRPRLWTWANGHWQRQQ
jgi:hypothetical protein